MRQYGGGDDRNEVLAMVVVSIARSIRSLSFFAERLLFRFFLCCLWSGHRRTLDTSSWKIQENKCECRGKSKKEWLPG